MKAEPKLSELRPKLQTAFDFAQDLLPLRLTRLSASCETVIQY